MQIGYARVSTKHQRESLDQQINLLKKSGCKEIYSEIISGANSKRPELTKLLGQIKSGDTLTISSVDRLGRSLKDLITIISDFKYLQSISLVANIKQVYFFLYYSTRAGQYQMKF